MRPTTLRVQAPLSSGLEEHVRQAVWSVATFLNRRAYAERDEFITFLELDSEQAGGRKSFPTES